MQINFSSYSQDSFVTKLYSIAGPYVNLADTLMGILQVSRQEVVDRLKGNTPFSFNEMEAIKDGFNNSALDIVNVA